MGPLPATASHAAIERLYRSHGGVVLRRARALLGDESDAQEALQEIFSQLLREPDSLERVSSVVGWLYQATTHHCLNLLRGRRTGARLLDEVLAPGAPSAVGPRAPAAAELRDLLSRLPDEQAAAIVYHHLDGMSHEEVAAQLGCSRRKVGYLLERAQGLLANWEHPA
jgi:RNA polymerase sigma-70 factor (ECF subfamily)